MEDFHVERVSLQARLDSTSLQLANARSLLVVARVWLEHQCRLFDASPLRFESFLWSPVIHSVAGIACFINDEITDHRARDTGVLA